MMGSPAGNQPPSNEGPQHEVTLTKPFYMGKYEVTQKQYEKLMEENPSKFKDGPDASQRPMESVKWEQAVAFCGKLSQITRRSVRLPTEAEWEYACRAGTTTRFSFGDDSKQFADYAWDKYSANHAAEPKPVGKKLPNPWGLHDMHGNVAEWCQDSYTGRYEAGPAVDPRGPSTGGSGHVIRGGGWLQYWGRCTSTYRGGGYAAGFRVVVGLKDDLELVRANPKGSVPGPGGNLVVNGDFECGRLDGWHLGGYGPRATVVNEGPYAGKFCVKFVTAPHMPLSQNVPVQEGKQYVLTWRIRVPEQADFAQNAKVEGGTKWNLRPLPEWTLYEHRFIAKADSYTVRFDFGGKGTFFLDDIRLTAAEGAPAPAGANLLPNGGF
jgi:hypothetical protein